MPAIVFLGILFAVIAAIGMFALMFISVILEGPAIDASSLSQEQARELFRELSTRRVDPANSNSPTIGEIVRQGHLEELWAQTPRSTVS